MAHEDYDLIDILNEIDFDNANIDDVDEAIEQNIKGAEEKIKELSESEISDLAGTF